MQKTTANPKNQSSVFHAARHKPFVESKFEELNEWGKEKSVVASPLSATPVAESNSIFSRNPLVITTFACFNSFFFFCFCFLKLFCFVISFSYCLEFGNLDSGTYIFAAYGFFLVLWNLYYFVEVLVENESNMICMWIF